MRYHATHSLTHTDTHTVNTFNTPSVNTHLHLVTRTHPLNTPSHNVIKIVGASRDEVPRHALTHTHRHTYCQHCQYTLCQHTPTPCDNTPSKYIFSIFLHHLTTLLGGSGVSKNRTALHHPHPLTPPPPNPPLTSSF